MSPDAPVPYYPAYLPAARRIPAIPYRLSPAGRSRPGRTGTGGQSYDARLPWPGVSPVPSFGDDPARWGLLPELPMTAAELEAPKRRRPGYDT